MKMKTIIKLLFVFSLPFIFCRCADDGIHYEREINVPEGIYLTGSASQFSVEAINGIMGRERFCKTTTVRCQLILWLLEPAVSE